MKSFFLFIILSLWVWPQIVFGHDLSSAKPFAVCEFSKRSGNPIGDSKLTFFKSLTEDRLGYLLVEEQGEPADPFSDFNSLKSIDIVWDSKTETFRVSLGEIVITFGRHWKSRVVPIRGPYSITCSTGNF